MAGNADRPKNVKPAGTLEDLAARQKERQDLVAFAESLDGIPESLTGGKQAPGIAREILQRSKSIGQHDADAAAMLSSLARLDAVKTAGLLQRMSLLDELYDSPAFSLAVARVYFQRIDSLVSTILSPLNKTKGGMWERHLEEYEKYADLPALEATLLKEAARRNIDMPRLIAIAEVIERRTKHENH